VILGQTYPYLRDSALLDQVNADAPDTTSGGLTRASLAGRAVSAVHFFVASQHVSRPSLQDLERRFGPERVALREVFELASLAARHPYVIAARPGTFDTVSRTRDATDGPPPYPIFAVLDRLPMPHGVVRLWTALLCTHEYDALAGTGHASAGAVRAMCLVSRIFASWNQIGEWLRRVDALRQTA
jgi:hypothetical protein